MKRHHRFSLVVRQIVLAVVLILPFSFALAQEVPKAPANHVYDPDFLLTQAATKDMGDALARFAAVSDLSVYLAVYMKTPKPMDAIAADLSQAWNQTGYGAVIVFLPNQRDALVLPSPQLSLIESSARLTKIFRDAAFPRLDIGDFSGASEAGAVAIVKELQHAEEQSKAKTKSWTLATGWWLAILGVVLLAALFFVWRSARVWHYANLFDHRYRFPEVPAPAALRFGGMRCGGEMATTTFAAALKSKDV